MKVTIDHKEPERVKAAIAAIPDCVVEFAELPCGDFLVSQEAAIERKEANDFASSILDGRFLAQARLLSDTYKKSFWIIEGDLGSIRSALTPQALTGAISYIGALLGSSVLQVRNMQETAMTVTTIARHLQEGLRYVPNLRPGKPKNVAGFAEFIVSGLPSVGGAKAQALLAHFGSAKAVMNAPESELVKVKGISARVAAEIRAVLDGDARG